MPILCLLTATLAGSVMGQEAVLRVNLVGYPLNGPKRALLLSKGQSRERLWLVSEQGGKRKLLGMRLSDRTPWPPFSHCYEVDMDSVSTEGRYRIEGTT